MGTMHCRHRDFVGTDRAKRDTFSQRQIIDAIRKEQSIEKAMGRWQPDWLGMSVEELAAQAQAADGAGVGQAELNQDDDKVNVPEAACTRSAGP